MEEAGLSAQMAVGLLNSPSKKTSAQFKLFLKHLKSGLSITDSGYKSGLFSEFDRQLLHAGEFSGNIGQVYKQLSRFYAAKDIRTKQLKSKLYLPFLILLLFIFISPLPALFSNTLSASVYIWTSSIQLIQIALFFYLSFNLIPWLTNGPLKFLGLSPLIYQIQIGLPGISSWIYARQINLFMTYLAMMLASGVVITEAAEKALRTINNPKLRTKFHPLITSLNNGISFAESLRSISEINELMIQKVVVGEESGRLAETILHFANIDSEELAAQDTLLAEWIPRIIYIVILVLVGYSMINNASISSI